jgi:hypothetical protein
VRCPFLERIRRLGEVVREQKIPDTVIQGILQSYQFLVPPSLFILTGEYSHILFSRRPTYPYLPELLRSNINVMSIVKESLNNSEHT